jgi:hypothetical protein
MKLHWLLLLIPCSLAQAQGLSIGSTEHGPWAQTVAALQADRFADGRTIHVVVRDEGNVILQCGSYALSLDPIGASAFRVGECNPVSNATAMTLVARTELFSHDSIVPRPRSINLYATQVRTGLASGGAEVSGGSALDCSVGIRPYLDDLEHGTHVYLGPDRFMVHPNAVGIEVESRTDGWLLRSGTRASLTIAYDVVDRSNGEVVLTDRATLVCASGDQADPLPIPAPEPAVTSAPPITTSSSMSEGDSTLLTWAGALYIGAGAAFGTAIYFAIEAVNEHSRLQERCEVSACTEHDLVDMHTSAVMSDVFFGLSLGQAVLASFFLLLGLPTETSSPSASLTPTGLRVTF